jgi:hypothetical protein
MNIKVPFEGTEEELVGKFKELFDENRREIGQNDYDTYTRNIPSLKWFVTTEGISEQLSKIKETGTVYFMKIKAPSNTGEDIPEIELTLKNQLIRKYERQK